VDPDEGYTRTLMDMAKRMSSSAKIVADDINGNAAKVAKASLSGSALVLTPLSRRQDCLRFL
jgi:hypothetical protein